MFVEARNPFLLPVESQRDGMFQADFAYGAYASNMSSLWDSEEGRDGHLCYKHAVPTELSRNFSIY
jgi:hypothetical protein